MADQITRIYRNDSENEYNIPGIGWLGPDQRISVSSEFPPAVNLTNYSGVVDVLAEEEAGKARDYEVNPEADYEEPVASEIASNPVEGASNV